MFCFQALTISSEDDFESEFSSEMVCKIHSELSHIKYKVFQSCQKTPQVLLVLHGVTPQEIPVEYFGGRSYVKFPQRYDMSDDVDNDDDDFRKLVGIILNTEPIQLDTPFSLQTNANG